jgi:hypothetical protein
MCTYCGIFTCNQRQYSRYNDCAACCFYEQFVADLSGLFLWKNQKGYVRVRQYWGAFTKPLLPWKAIHICVCVCLCTRARVDVLAQACACLLIQYATCRRHIVCVMSPPYFSTLSRKPHNFREKVTEHIMCVLIFSTSFIRKISQSKKNFVTNVKSLHKSTCHFCHILMKPEFSKQIFGKVSNMTFHQNPSSGSQVVPCRQTDGRT